MSVMPSLPRTTVAPARACAHRVLRRVFERGAYAERAFVKEASELPPPDRALAMRLAFGAVQRAGTSDHLVELLAGRPANGLDGPVAASLRLGLYELLYLHGAPDYAVVHDAVELAKSERRGGHRLVNAVLRRAAREGAELLGGLGERTPAEAAVKHSHPRWIAELMWEVLGAEQARLLMARDNEASEVALRVNTLVCERARLAERLPVATRPDALLAEALVLEQPFDMRDSPLWREGAFTAQSRAAMLVAHALAPLPGERVLDLCAAPGGKTTHIAALMDGRGAVVAVEADARRARALEATAARMRTPNITVEVADARLLRDGEPFDRVLVDPPCSGLGTLQARPDLRWRISLAAVEEMREEQFRILDSGARALRPGGVLVYSTCTISPTENERLIADFLAAHPDFELDDVPTGLDSFALSSPITGDPPLPARGGLVQTLPHRDATAGFFIARLRRL